VELGLFRDQVRPDAAVVEVPAGVDDLAVDILAPVLGGGAVADVDDPAADAALRGTGDASQRRRIERRLRRAATDADRCALEQPAVAGHLLDVDLLEPERVHLVGEVVGGLPVLGGSEDPEPVRHRPDPRQVGRHPLHVAHVEGIDRADRLGLRLGRRPQRHRAGQRDEQDDHVRKLPHRFLSWWTDAPGGAVAVARQPTAAAASCQQR